MGLATFSRYQASATLLPSCDADASTWTPTRRVGTKPERSTIWVSCDFSHTIVDVIDGEMPAVAKGPSADELRNYGRTVLSEWEATQTWQPALQLRAATFSSARDYAGRFLLELLQNGHDAHPSDRADGRIRILLDEGEGSFGTLYVANGGIPFTWPRVEAICKFARSEKTVGEGIGNKGIGFRSVLEITDAPEIYSARSSGPGPVRLDGYRFRFATEDDLRVLLQDGAKASRAAREFPPFQIPFPIMELPPVCEELASDGHVTVVRLPLRSEAAYSEVSRRMQELAIAETPVMLFLHRLERLVLETKTAGGRSSRTELRRGERPLDQDATAVERDVPMVSLAHVELDPQGEFLVARGHLPPERLISTITAAVGLGSLDESWLQWSEPAVVEIALPLRPAAFRRGQVFTFLPLGGDVVAPASGHINAPFFTKMDRTALDRGHPLNTMLFDAVAETCLVAAMALRETATADARRMVVDLVSWEATPGSADLLLSAAKRVHGCAFRDVPLVPVPGHNAWSTPAESILWSADDLAVLTARAAADVGVTVADPEVGDRRLRRLAKMCEWLKCPLEPSAEDTADHVERIIATLPLPGPDGPVDLWNGVYADLERLFREQGQALQGKRLLLADDGTLQRCNSGAGGVKDARAMKSRREAFFQPARTETDSADGLAVPEALRKRLFYLHPDLQWMDDEGHVRRQEARLFLEKHRLVRRFDSAGLLDHVRSALEESSSKKLRAQALKFVFRLYRSRRSAQSLQLNAIGLYVQSVAGPFVLASEAAFGAGWNNTTGEDLAGVVAEGREAASALRWLGGRLIAPPNAFVSRGETQEEWHDFLKELGVTDGLIPVVTFGARTTANGSELEPDTIIKMAKPPVGVADQWKPYITRSARTANYPYTPYIGAGAFRLPGQDVVREFSEPGRLAYARLVLHGLAHWPERYFNSVWTRDRPGDKDPQQVLTPLAAFVREQPWLPVRGHGRAIVFARPADAWHSPAGIEEEPSFAQTIAHSVRPLLDSGNTLSRLRKMGLPTWGSRRDSARLIAALGKLVNSGAVGTADRPALQRANEQAWTDLTHLADALPSPASALEPLKDAVLVIEAGGQLTVVDGAVLREGSIALYITDERDHLTARLIRETEQAMLVVPGRSRQAFLLLRQVFPDAVRHADEAGLDVRVDDNQATDLAELGKPLCDQLPWMPHAIGILADHFAEGPRPAEADLINLVATAYRIHMHCYTSLDITLDDEAVMMPSRQAGLLPLPDEDHPLILAPIALEDTLEWDVVALLSEAVSHVVKRPEFAVRLKLAAHELRSRHADLVSPTEVQLAQAFDISTQQVRETSLRLDGSVTRVLERCYPLLVHALGTSRAQKLTNVPASDVRSFQNALLPYEQELPLPAEKLVPAARNARDIDELRALAGIDFAEFNRTLAGLGPKYRPISHADAHEEALRKHIDLHRSDTVTRLRWAFLGQFDAREPIDGWPELRSLRWITAPGSWAFTRDRVGDELLREHVEEELTVRLGASAPGHGENLPALDRLRIQNTGMIRELAPNLMALIQTAQHPLPAILAGLRPTQDVTDLLDKCGALDFRELTEDSVVAWLETLGQWPTGMPRTTNLAAHGLTLTDFDPQRRAAEQARQERARQLRLISLGGRELDVGSGDFAQVVTELERTLQTRPDLTAGRNRFATPQPPTTRAMSSFAEGGQGRYVERGLSSIQRTAIGFVGEWFAYQWLRDNYPAADESSWVSTNRQHVFPSPLGDDGLGFDFRVGSGKQPLMFEVKATQGNGGQIELGESEVRAAQRFAGSDRWRILAITFTLDPDLLKITMLPNPFSARGRDAYREEGGALRFSYRI